MSAIATIAERRRTIPSIIRPSGATVKHANVERGPRFGLHGQRNRVTSGGRAGGESCRATTPPERAYSLSMRIALISDIHGNLPALEAVLADVAKQKPDAVYCLGDLVGYGASPNEVSERIRAEGMPTIMGNYDDGVGFDRDECGCAYRDPADKELGDRSLAWTKVHTTPENKVFLRTLLKELRFEADGKRVLLVHGSPRKMNEYLFEDRALSTFQRLAASSNADIIAFGHTHKPYEKTVDGALFVNAGSVGKPKDLDWRACYVILDGDAVTFQRVSYDVAKAAAAIRATDLPHEFATDIETGGVPRTVAAKVD
jgi:putative phosphoesterase